MTNTMVAVYARNGGRLAAFPMSSILGFGSHDDLSDPQIAWDPATGAWIATAMDESSNTTEISVSDGPDPEGGWFDYSFGYGSRLCPDQPRLGFSSLVIVVATELFNGTCHSSANSGARGGVMLVVDKQQVLAHANNVAASQYGPSVSYDNFVPVQMLAASPVEYLASTDLGSSSVVHVFTLHGVPPSDQLSLQNTLLISRLLDPTYAAQCGGGVINAGDDRINDASWQGGVLYLAADDSCSYANDRYLETCARLIEISTSAVKSTLLGEDDIGFPNGDAYFAALRPDGHGNAIVLFGYSSPNDYPSLAATAAIGPILGEEGRNFVQPVALALGTSPSVARWGDYQGAAVDPTNPRVIWTAGQVGDELGLGSPYDWARTSTPSASATPSPMNCRTRSTLGTSTRGTPGSDGRSKSDPAREAVGSQVCP